MEEARKKEENFQTMIESLADKERRLKFEREREAEENRKYKEYLDQLEEREY